MVWPDFRAHPATRRFEGALLAEHLDEAAFLYEQRRQQLGADDAWTVLGEVETRLEAHLDAVAVAGSRALEGTLARAAAGGAAELFVAACLACRREDWAAFRKLATALPSPDDGHGQALADAFYVEAPRQWATHVQQLLSITGERTPPELVVACGRRRLQLNPVLVPMLEVPALAAAAAMAVGRLHDQRALDPLRACVQRGDEAARKAALTALCRLGDTGTLRRLVTEASPASWWHEVAGVAGDAAAMAALVHSVQDGASQSSTVLALGLLGDPAAFPTLLDLLSDPQRAVVAARALNWTTGAGLVEKYFVPEEVDEAALSAEELRVWKESRQAPRRSDGTEFGSQASQPLTDRQAWQDWLVSHASDFERGRPYRLGRPLGALVVAEGLALPRADPSFRAAMVEELAIRFGCELPLETDLPVSVQQRLIRRIATWAATGHPQRGAFDR